MFLEQVIEELEEQLRYAELENEEYAEELKKAIKILKEYKEDKDV